MKLVDRAVSVYKTNSQMGRGFNSQTSLDYFEGGKNQPSPSTNTKNSAHSFDKILQLQIKKSSLR